MIISNFFANTSIHILILKKERKIEEAMSPMWWCKQPEA